MSDWDTNAEALPGEPLDAADERALRRHQNRLKRQAREARRFWNAVFANPVGRREMWGVLEALKAFEVNFACGPNGFPQPEATWFKAGRQSVIRDLHSRLQMLDHGAVYDMLCENHPAFVTAIRRTVKYG